MFVANHSIRLEDRPKSRLHVSVYACCCNAQSNNNKKTAPVQATQDPAGCLAAWLVLLGQLLLLGGRHSACSLLDSSASDSSFYGFSD
jgi:hypothetical protein